MIRMLNLINEQHEEITSLKEEITSLKEKLQTWEENYRDYDKDRFFIDNGKIRDILGFVEPIEFTSMHQGIVVRNLLNKNWEQFNIQKCRIQRLRKENKRLHKINGELHRRVHKANKCLYVNGFGLND